MKNSFHCKLFYFSFFALIITAFLFFSCSKKQTEASLTEQDKNEIAVGTHSWYAFTPNGFEQVDLPQNANDVQVKAWTESIRITDAICAEDKRTNQIPLAYALVNRLGMLVFDGSTPKIYTDLSIFTDKTANNLFFENDSPIFSVYKSLFFNDTTSTHKAIETSDRPFLIEFNPSTKLFFPLINYENLSLSNNSQITDFTWNSKQLLCSVKETTNQKNTFSYLSVTPTINLLSVSPSTAQNSLFIGESSAEEFRSSQNPKDFSKAPERLKQLLAPLPNTMPLFVECSYAGGDFPTLYRQMENSVTPILEAKAIISDTWAMAIFSDGTSYFSGACFDRPILSSGKTIAFRLPKLPNGFKYSYFALSGTQLYVAWEETSFYQTARSGFISVNLDSTLYSKLRRSPTTMENSK